MSKAPMTPAKLIALADTLERAAQYANAIGRYDETTLDDHEIDAMFEAAHYLRLQAATSLTI